MEDTHPTSVESNERELHERQHAVIGLVFFFNASIFMTLYDTNPEITKQM